MLDEPSLGLAPRMVAELLAIASRIAREQGVTVLMVEQNVRKALQVADYGYVLERGRIVAQGDSRELLASDVIRRAYLGTA
jgi:branched-chain amino acid transport system ATP-binding protein